MIAHYHHLISKSLKVRESRREELADGLISEVEALVETSRSRENVSVAGGGDGGDAEPGSEDVSIERIMNKEMHRIVSILSNGLTKSTSDEQEAVLLAPDGWIIGDVVSFCQAKMDESTSVFLSITKHHHALKEAAVTKEMVWADALQDSSQGLESYAEAAVRMGNKNWVREGHRWTESIAEEYYLGELGKKTWVNASKEEHCRRADGTFDREKLQRLKDSSRAPPLRSEDGKMNLLDVGSCFNPHASGSKRDLFEVVAVDLVPQHATVLSCDFIRVGIGDDLLLEEGRLKVLPRDYFHIVTMSLVLCYLPTANEREAMVLNARQALVKESSHSPGGILLVSEKGSIFPVSGRLHTRYLRTWTAAMGRIGFGLVRYETKVVDGNKRLHLFAFRRIEKEADSDELLIVPQLVIKSDFSGLAHQDEQGNEQAWLDRHLVHV